MKKQKVVSQMKGQDKTPEKQLNEVKTGNLPDKEFIIIIVKMIQDLEKRMEAKIEKTQEMFTKDLEELKDEQTEMNSTLEGISGTITEAEKWINDLEDRMVEINATEQNIEKRMKRNEDSLRDLWHNIKQPTFALSRSQKEKGERKDPEKIFEEIIAENFPNMGKETVNQVQGAQSPRQVNPRRNTPRQVIKLTKIKDR